MSPASTSPSPAAPTETAPLMLRGLRARRDRLIRFVDRDQGLILPKGNPAQVKSFRDIAGRRLRFINRQRGSGTRIEIDQLIAHERIDGMTSSVTATKSLRTAPLRQRWRRGAPMPDSACGPRPPSIDSHFSRW